MTQIISSFFSTIFMAISAIGFFSSIGLPIYFAICTFANILPSSLMLIDIYYQQSRFFLLWSAILFHLLTFLCVAFVSYTYYTLFFALISKYI